MITEFCNEFFIEYTGVKDTNSFTTGGIYKVVDIIDHYYYLVIDNNNEEYVLEPHLTRIFPLLKVRIKNDLKESEKNNNNKKNSFSIIDLIKNKIYDVLAIESISKNDIAYRIIDESDEDYLYPKDQFIIVQDNRKNIDKIR